MNWIIVVLCSIVRHALALIALSSLIGIIWVCLRITWVKNHASHWNGHNAIGRKLWFLIFLAFLWQIIVHRLWFSALNNVSTLETCSIWFLFYDNSFFKLTKIKTSFYFSWPILLILFIETEKKLPIWGELKQLLMYQFNQLILLLLLISQLVCQLNCWMMNSSSAKWRT